MPQELIKDLILILAYIGDNEIWEYEQLETSEKDNHIGLSFLNLRNWLIANDNDFARTYAYVKE